MSKALDEMCAEYEMIWAEEDDCPARRTLGGQYFCMIPISDFECPYHGKIFTYAGLKPREHYWCKYRSKNDKEQNNDKKNAGDAQSPENNS